MSLNTSPNVEGVIVISSDELPSEYFVRKILGVDALPNTNVCSNSMKGYLWQFETKYYSAEVMLYTVQEKIPLASNVSDSIKSTVLCFDSSKLSSFEEILSWMPFLKNIESEVQLLVCNNCCAESTESAPIKKNVLNWCVENHFELVELNPDEESDSEDCIIEDVKGYSRIIEALQSYTWANLVMKSENCAPCKEEQKDCHSDVIDKSETKEGSPLGSLENKSEDKEANTEVASTQNAEENSKECKKVQVDNEELLLEEKWLENVFNGDDPDGESFEALFSKFATMKERASGLTGEDRKKYAEKVAIAFWRAMGGDEDEIDGLEDE